MQGLLFEDNEHERVSKNVSGFTLIKLERKYKMYVLVETDEYICDISDNYVSDKSTCFYFLPAKDKSTCDIDENLNIHVVNYFETKVHDLTKW